MPPEKVLALPARASVRPDPFAGDTEAPQREARFGAVVLWATTLALVGLGTLMTVRNRGGDAGQAPRENPQQVYGAALSDLQGICQKPIAGGRGGVGRHCVEVARTLLGMPECTDGCQRLARAFVPRAGAAR